MNCSFIKLFKPLDRDLFIRALSMQEKNDLFTKKRILLSVFLNTMSKIESELSCTYIFYRQSYLNESWYNTNKTKKSPDQISHLITYNRWNLFDYLFTHNEVIHILLKDNKMEVIDMSYFKFLDWRNPDYSEPNLLYY